MFSIFLGKWGEGGGNSGKAESKMPKVHTCTHIFLTQKFRPNRVLAHKERRDIRNASVQWGVEILRGMDPWKAERTTILKYFLRSINNLCKTSTEIKSFKLYLFGF